MRLAVYQGNAEPLAFDANLALVDRAAEEASAGGAELLLTRSSSSPVTHPR
jgi:predicted amidohydrolase